MPTAGSRAALCPSLFLVCGMAFAQVGGNIAFLSDDRYRGISLSQEKPTLRLSAAYDHEDGWFGGGSLTEVMLYRPRWQVQVLGYAGYAGRLSDRFGWEAGATVVHFGADSHYDYLEAFGGLSGERWNTRLHYSPDYFGSDVRTAYAEFNVGLPISPLVRVTAHAGALMRIGGAPVEGRRVTFDGSLGLAMARDAWEAQIAWVAGGRSAIYPTAYGRASQGTLMLSASLSF
ncbi:TorF family putative porin [Variovorax ureilyticus]|uniref:TorF family putative porin n=1 Tax=Variovorax ureilyticus TaxID=1836198 RepID=A0ABU8VGS2_9BURK